MLTLESEIWFGKYKGQALKDVPGDYLLFLYNKNIAKGDLRIYINSILPTLNAQNSINNKKIYFHKKYYLKKVIYR